MKYISLIVFLLFTNVSIACDCVLSPETFLKSIQSFTAELEVVKIDTFKKAQDWLDNEIVLTKLKVVKEWGSSSQVEYVWIDNSTGTDCQLGLSPDSIGQHYIITGSVYESKAYAKYLHPTEKNTFLYATTCGNPIIYIRGDTAIGHISVNKEKDLINKYSKLLHTSPQKAAEFNKKVFESKFHPSRYQFMKIDECYELIQKEKSNP